MLNSISSTREPQTRQHRKSVAQEYLSKHRSQKVIPKRRDLALNCKHFSTFFSVLGTYPA